MNKISIFNLLLTVTVGTLGFYITNLQSGQKTEFEKFAEKFAPPADVRRTLESNTYHFWGPITGWNLPFLKSPNLYIKENEIDRPFYAAYLQKVIHENNLDIGVPKKYIYNKQTLLDPTAEIYGYRDNWIVAAEPIEIDRFYSKPITLKEIQDLITLQKKTGYGDFLPDNVVRDKKTGKIMIIDTEERSFEGSDRLKHISRLHAFDYLDRYMCLHSRDQEGDKILVKTRNHLGQNKKSTTPRNMVKKIQDSHFLDVDIKKAMEEVGYVPQY